MGSSSSTPTAPPRSPPPPNPELDKPWRNFDWGKKKDLKEELENFSPSHPDVKDIKILVAGQIGAGKSSFINSVDSAFQGRISSRALVNSAVGFDHSFTRNFNKEQALTYKDQHYTCDPELSDQAFCLVYVIGADTVQYTDDRLIDKLKIIRQRISDKGIPQVVVMTKVDEACPLVQKDLRKIYTSKKIKEKMYLCSTKVGVPLTNIFPVKNYHEEIDTNDDIDVLILKALEQIVQLANDRVQDSANY